jgi:hypothetical protein
VHVAAVDLDDEALVAPGEVGLGAAAARVGDPGADLRSRQRAVAADLQEALLELAAREGAAGR